MKVYVFLIQRGQDKEPWPVAYTDKGLAEQALGRVSAVAEVELTKLHAFR
jgi:hypothetical protein